MIDGDGSPKRIAVVVRTKKRLILGSCDVVRVMVGVVEGSGVGVVVDGLVSVFDMGLGAVVDGYGDVGLVMW